MSTWSASKDSLCVGITGVMGLTAPHSRSFMVPQAICLCCFG